MLSSDELEQIRAHVEDQRKWKIHGEWLPGCTGASNIQWPPGDPNSWPLAFPVVCWSEAVDDESVGAQAKFIGWAERGEHSTRITHTFWIRSPDDPKAQPLHADASRLLEHIASLTRKLEAQGSSRRDAAVLQAQGAGGALRVNRGRVCRADEGAHRPVGRSGALVRWRDRRCHSQAGPIASQRHE